ncbi:hypothetical protein N781_16730 [Pontibacillus halophilus JSM 076056 = DSM 19796]|uniref:Uncharacterized protein n=1 Tax=Pontibacillus halophilus JSM 076056 = DSM 19796 TaxID=1385510 RepID=A0A0A5I9M0_9BACI|nr:hypothetical protein [Pontibacillus halophilus]KGX92502.1 hypothetical protein N781_16730 [Pontibacillus halophilus JSM 076056 = DSM 19796]
MKYRVVGLFHKGTIITFGSDNMEQYFSTAEEAEKFLNQIKENDKFPEDYELKVEEIPF